MDTDPVVAQLQRKIELQAPADLTYLITNVRNAATTILDEALPKRNDSMRNEIEALVDEFITKTFSLASPNLSINGLPVPPNALLKDPSSTVPDEVYEPFDYRKRRRVADLVTQEEKLLEEVAALKRSVPSRAAAEYAERERAAIEADEASMRERALRAADVQVRLAIDDLERQGSVEGGFRTAVDGLGRLKRDMPAVVAKMERARVAGEYVMTDGR